jgi:hypothetical protein
MEGSPMRLPRSAHTARPWRIHQLGADFRLEDVWALPTPGDADDLPRLAAMIASGDSAPRWPFPARELWALRWKLGSLLRLDNERAGVNSRVPTLRERMPDDLRGAPTGPGFGTLPFTPLYPLEDEWAAELANNTVHAVMHIGWVPDETGGYRGEMAVLVKPNGLLGKAYLAAIRPLRYLVVYPALIRSIGRQWRTLTNNPATSERGPHV